MKERIRVGRSGVFVYVRVRELWYNSFGILFCNEFCPLAAAAANR